MNKKYIRRCLTFMQTCCLLAFGGIMLTSAAPYPQPYSFQTPGNLPAIDLPNIPTVDGVAVYANETLVSVAAITVDETVLLPLNETIKAFGGKTEILGDNRVKISTETASFILSADGKTLSWNDDAVILNTAATVVEGILYAPGQVFAEILNAKVWYSEALEMIVVSTGKYKDDNILRNIGASFWMNGEPFYEISYNKYDLANQLAADPDFNGGYYIYGSPWTTPETTKAGAERALKDLSDNGFKTIRVFCFHVNLDSKQAEVDKFWAYSDYMYDLCDKYGIRMVVNMGLTGPEFIEGSYVNGKWVQSETYYDLITNKNSKSRQNVNEFIEQYINRYKDRDTVLMWEIVNEGALDADVGYNTGEARYSLWQLGQYYSDMTEQIKKHDPDHLVISGDSLLRSAQWNLFSGVMKGQDGPNWETDTEAERLKALWLLNQDLDAISVHGYGVGYENSSGCAHYYEVKGPRKDLKIVTWEFLMKEAKTLGLPLYNGECGGMLAEDGKTELQGVQNNTPEAAEARERYLKPLVDAGVQLTHWWTYQSDCFGTADLSRYSISLKDTPKNFAVIKAANEELQARYMVNPLDTDNTHTLSGKEGDGSLIQGTTEGESNAISTADTLNPSGGQKGCTSVLGSGLVHGAALGGLWLTIMRKKNKRANAEKTSQA